MDRALSVADRPPRRVYYGWYVVAACNLVAVMTWGIGVFNQGVFLGYFAAAYGWPRAELSLGPTLFYVWAGLVGVAVGRAIDQIGPRPVLLVGALALGAGTTALGFAREIWHVYPGFLLLGTGYGCLHTVTLGAIVSRWFVRQRARAMALATFGATIGGMILVPLNAALLERWGGPVGGLTLAVIAVVVVVPLAIWVVKDDPAAVGQAIDSAELNASAAAVRESGDVEERGSRDAEEREWTVAGALRTRAFWAVALCFHLTMLAQGGFLIHQVLFLQPTFGFVGAASVVSLTTVAGGVGRAGFAVIGDRWPARRVAAAMFVFQAFGLALSALGGVEWALVLGSLSFGLTMGIIVAIQPIVAADCFGRRSFGRIYGPIYLAIQLGTGFGSSLFGLVATAAGSYRTVLLDVSATLLLAAFGLRWAVRPTAGRYGYNRAN